MGQYETKKLLTVKKTIKKKRHKLNKNATYEWEKLIANGISDKTLVSKIYKELINSTSKSPSSNMMEYIGRGSE